MKIEPDFMNPDEEHIHDQTIVSVGITEGGDLEMDKMNGWLGTLLREKGVDIYRMKGVLAIKGQEQRFVFQGIHMLFDVSTHKQSAVGCDDLLSNDGWTDQ